MFSLNINIIIDVTLVICGGIYMFQFLRYRKNSESIMTKYKPGTLEHEAYGKLFSRKRLIVSVFVVAAILVKTIVDIINFINSEGIGALSELIPTLMLALIIVVIGLVVINPFGNKS